MTYEGSSLEPTPEPEVSAGISIDSGTAAPIISTKYYPNGTRDVYIDEAGDGSIDVGVVGYCGGVLVEVSIIGFRGVANSQTVGHIACADNRLTMEDSAPLPR